MDHVTIWSEMDRLTAMMVEKGIPNPKAEVWLKNGELWQVNLWGNGIAITGGLIVFYDGSLEDSIDAAEKHIAALPSTAERNLRAFQKKVAEAIDLGNANGIEAQWLNPLVETARALASNALPPAEGAA